MSNLTVNLSLPRDLLGILNIPESQLNQQILEIVALSLFQQQYISAGKGGEILGISKIDFIQLLAKNNIPYFNELPDELSTEITDVEHLLDSAKS